MIPLRELAEGNEPGRLALWAEQPNQVSKAIRRQDVLKEKLTATLCHSSVKRWGDDSQAEQEEAHTVGARSQAAKNATQEI